MEVPSGLELTWLLSSCASEPELNGILLLDLPSDSLTSVAYIFSTLLDQFSPRAPLSPPRVVVLGSHHNEDDLWGYQGPLAALPDGTPLLGAGLLAARTPEDRLIVVLPDLSRISLPVARAAVSILGSSPYLARGSRGVPDLPSAVYFLAACASSDVASISPHLLDRFCIRFPAAEIVGRIETMDRLASALEGSSLALEVAPPPPDEWGDQARAPGMCPEVTVEAADRATALHASDHGMRRPLALLRLARAGARLSGDSHVTPGHVERAAVLSGILAGTGRDPASKDVPSPVSPRAIPGPSAGPQGQPRDSEQVLHPAVGVAPPAEEREEVDLHQEDLELLVPLDPGGLALRPYPEDEQQPLHEANPLRMPWQRSRGLPEGRGLSVGTRPPRSLSDISWTATLTRAALYQAFRRRTGGEGDRRIAVRGADLRQHRRLPQPEHMLVLILDHTCAKGQWDWFPHIAPQLHEAYTRRSSLCVVEVGRSDSTTLVRAELLIARSMLDPQVDSALVPNPGGASPLAHGLQLAHSHIRHALQHGDASTSRVTLVLVTDALGNVPLAASEANRVPEGVAGEGVTDANEAALRILELDSVETHIIAPPGILYPDLLSGLAASLGSSLIFTRPGDS